MKTQLFIDSVAPTTWKAYQKYWEEFCLFYTQRFGKGRMVISSACLPDYITQLSMRNYKDSTIKTRLAGIKFMACLNNIVMKSDPYVTNRLLEGIKRGATRTKLLPITRDILHEVIDNVKYHTNETYQRNLITPKITLETLWSLSVLLSSVWAPDPAVQWAPIFCGSQTFSPLFCGSHNYATYFLSSRFHAFLSWHT